MAWRIVKQPNDKLARFSDIVDDFTDFNMTKNEAVKMCCTVHNMSVRAAEEKVRRGINDSKRWADEIETIAVVHGENVAKERTQQLSE
jgi:hypothetical protein